MIQVQARVQVLAHGQVLAQLHDPVQEQVLAQIQQQLHMYLYPSS
jgi:hypothetical protein